MWDLYCSTQLWLFDGVWSFYMYWINYDVNKIVVAVKQIVRLGINVARNKCNCLLKICFSVVRWNFWMTKKRMTEIKMSHLRFILNFKTNLLFCNLTSLYICSTILLSTGLHIFIIIFYKSIFCITIRRVSFLFFSLKQKKQINL